MGIWKFYIRKDGLYLKSGGKKIYFNDESKANIFAKRQVAEVCKEVILHQDSVCFDDREDL